MCTPTTPDHRQRRRRPVSCKSLASVYGVLIGRIGRSVFRENYVSRGKLRVSLRFEQQRFYNPHHHPEMPRTLQSLDGRVGNGEDYNPMLYDQVYVSSKV